MAIGADGKSLKSRKMLLTFECPPDILINRSRPVHEATGGHAVRAYCRILSYGGNFAEWTCECTMPERDRRAPGVQGNLPDSL